MSMDQLLEHVMYGLSTGWDPDTRSDYPRAVADALRWSDRNVELSALSYRDLPLLATFLASPASSMLGSFDHLSIHGPAKHLPDDWTEMIEMLQTLPMYHAHGIVLHPDTIHDIGLVAQLGSRCIVENMDCRKDDCRTAPEMQRIFDALPEARFCLDVAHAWTIDPTLQEGHRLLDLFGDRLVEVHVSGIEPDGSHRITDHSDLERYASLLERCVHVPWVFESPYLNCI